MWIKESVDTIVYSCKQHLILCPGFTVGEAKELKEVTTTLGQTLSEEEFMEFWLEADVNNDGKLDYNEFIKMMMQY